MTNLLKVLGFIVLVALWLQAMSLSSWLATQKSDFMVAFAALVSVVTTFFAALGIRGIVKFKIKKKEENQ